MASRLLRRMTIFPIRVYQYMISPWLGRQCRFDPTCSQYAIDAIAQHGVVRGLCLGGWRILKCHPFHPGGTDEVPVPKQHPRPLERAAS